MADMIRFAVQGHLSRIPTDPSGTPIYSSRPRSIPGSKKASSFLCLKIGSQSSRRRALRVFCSKTIPGIVEKDETVTQSAGGRASDLSIVMKFGGSSVATADRMKEIAGLIRSFPEERPVIVLSAMGKTTNNLLLAGENAVTCGVSNVSELTELNSVKHLHLKTINELGIDGPAIHVLLDELEQLLKGIAMMKELTPRTRDYLVSFGECMSTRIFAEYLNKIGVKARQYDAFDIGFVTTDDFTNADILEASFPAIAKRLHDDWCSDHAIPIVTGFLGKGWKSSAVTTLGRGGSDLTATTIGKALSLREIQVNFEIGPSNLNYFSLSTHSKALLQCPFGTMFLLRRV